MLERPRRVIAAGGGPVGLDVLVFFVLLKAAELNPNKPAQTNLPKQT